ncbi:MAG: SDR family NAD(P)-dependent oxidoreductase [Anaerolineae bacterium]|jgi:NADP-dependent 3-hydroxy acid dehydrogenase YdfG|nr:SDR family NAD(P)-dependent oxidoreductase [Chloroflexota bacterium]
MKRGLRPGDVALITGASSGIGRALALEFARRGLRVALVARRQPELSALAREIAAAGGSALVVVGDVTSDDDLADAVTQVLRHWGHVDVLVANAGAYVQATAVDTTLADLQRALSVNVLGAARAVLAVLPHMLQRGSGHLVLMASQDAFIPIPGDGPYNASKAALSAWGQTLRQELRPRGVGVTVVYPGRIDTPLIAHLRVPAISPKASPARLAALVVRAVAQRRARLVYPATGYLYLVREVWPALGDWLIRVLRLQGWEAPQSKV